MIVSRRWALRWSALVLFASAAVPGPSGARAADGDPPARALRVAVIGDSLAQGLGSSLAVKARQTGQMTVLSAGVQSTGFTRYHELNWKTKLQAMVNDRRLDAVVMWIGLNDYRSIIDPETNRRHEFATPDWVRVYAQRIDDLIDVAKAAGIPLYWVALPALRDETNNRGMRAINRLQEERVVARNEQWIAIGQAVEGPDGSYLAYLPDVGRGPRRLRADDGAHFAEIGYRLVADLVLERMAAASARPVAGG